MRIAFGTDEASGVTAEMCGHLAAQGHDVVLVADGRSDEWPEVGRRVGEAVSTGGADVGVVCCWTGTGVSIAANKVAGVRAALCRRGTARACGEERRCGRPGGAGGRDGRGRRGRARRWNDANVLALGLRLTTATVASEILDAFLATPTDAAEAAAVERVEPAKPDR